MTPLATPESNESRELYDRAMKLSPEERESLALELLHTIDYPPEDPEEVKKAWHAELQKRLDDILLGRVKTYSVAESMAYLRQELAERSSR